MSEDVLRSENALIWDFPGRAAKIPLNTFLETSFQKNLALFLGQSSMESLSRFAARSVKAKVSIMEFRDTADPALITQMLLPLLEATGSPADVLRIRKRVRDDVNIDGAEIPWRRSPLWLVLRVATQLQFYHTLGNENGRLCYKVLICLVHGELLRDCTGTLAPELTITLKSKLCRRIAKLETEKSRFSALEVYKQLSDSVCPLLKETIVASTQQVGLAWIEYKRSITRSIPRLPSYAHK